MEYSKYHLYWGDMHTNVHGEPTDKDVHELGFGLDTHATVRIGTLEDTLKEARQHLDFFPVAYYPFFFYTKKGLPIESCGHRKRFSKEWEEVQRLIAEENSPGEFVTFLGYEWHGNRRRYGDHNVYYLRDYEPLDDSWTLPELFGNLRKTQAIAIPHHTGYQVGERGKDWNFHDEELSPFAEIYSAHGSSEGCDTPYSLDRNLAMAPRVSGGCVQEGLERGYRLGIIASGDNHYGYPGVWGNGLVGVYAKEQTREAIWEAFKKRRVYGVTGDRIRVEFFVNDHIMGEEFETNRPVDISGQIIGSHAIDRIEVIRNNRVIHSYCHSGNWDIPDTDQPVRVKMKVECGWGPNVMQGFKMGDKEWEGYLEVRNGKIISVEPCFTYFGQRINSISENRCVFTLRTKQRSYYRDGRCFQAIIFEIEARLKERIILKVNARSIDFSVEDALKNSRVVAFKDEVKKHVYDQFSLAPEEIENPDVYWHNAYKIKVHKAIPEEGYRVKFECTDGRPPLGRNYYYLRVSQLNGQMAWSSPIWVHIKEVSNQ